MSTTRRGTQVRLPQLGESVIEGTIGAWLKQVGERVEKYDPLVEITTDKVSAEVPSPIAGTLIQITAEEGQTLPVGAEICVIDEGGGATNGAEEQPAAPATGERPARREGADRPTGPDGEIELLRARSSPAVRRIAEEHGIDISRIEGTGIGGRVTKSDILRYIEQRAEARAEPAPAVEPRREEAGIAAAERAIQETIQPPTADETGAAVSAPPGAPPTRPAAPPEPPVGRQPVSVWPGDEVVPVSPMRRQIAEHMVRSERAAPHVTAWMEVDMSAIVEARARHKERFLREEGFELTYLPFAVKAAVHALREHPQVNAVWDEERIIRRKAINIGIAVSLDDGLVVPVIKHADERSIAGLARAIRDLASRARAGQLTVDDIQGGTFTVNNPGTFGTVMSTPIIVQPQAAILSTEAVVKRPVVIDDMIGARPIMNLSLSIDHRILDGMIAARFLATVKRWLEEYRPDTPLY